MRSRIPRPDTSPSTLSAWPRRGSMAQRGASTAWATRRPWMSEQSNIQKSWRSKSPRTESVGSGSDTVSPRRGYGSSSACTRNTCAAPPSASARRRTRRRTRSGLGKGVEMHRVVGHDPPRDRHASRLAHIYVPLVRIRRVALDRLPRHAAPRLTVSVPPRRSAPRLSCRWLHGRQVGLDRMARAAREKQADQLRRHAFDLE